jgi:proteasome lid subunit RPN8/RPN11
MQSLKLTKEQLQSMIQYVNLHAPLEACGLLAGENATVKKIFFVQNQAKSPNRFVMNPIEQLNAFNWIESNQMELLGVFHSHPTGPETVSPTDIKEAAYAVVQIVLSRVNENWHARGFWVEENDYSEIPLQIE